MKMQIHDVEMVSKHEYIKRDSNWGRFGKCSCGWKIMDQGATCQARRECKFNWNSLHGEWTQWG